MKQTEIIELPAQLGVNELDVQAELAGFPELYGQKISKGVLTAKGVVLLTYRMAGRSPVALRMANEMSEKIVNAKN